MKDYAKTLQEIVAYTAPELLQDRLFEFMQETINDLQAAVAAMMWQPIETAPKDQDETCILICCAHHMYPMMRVAYYEHEADPTYPWHVEDAAKGFNHHKDWPTHWMPLPAPPALTGDQQ